MIPQTRVLGQQKPSTTFPFGQHRSLVIRPGRQQMPLTIWSFGQQSPLRQVSRAVQHICPGTQQTSPWFGQHQGASAGPPQVTPVAALPQGVGTVNAKEGVARLTLKIVAAALPARIWSTRRREVWVTRSLARSSNGLLIAVRGSF